MGAAYAPIQEGIPGRVRRPAGAEGVEIDAPAEAGLTVDGAALSGPTPIARLRPDSTPIVRWGGKSLDVFSLDGSDDELRIYDAAAPTLADFEEIEYYDEDPGLVLEATYERFADTDDVPGTSPAAPTRATSRRSRSGGRHGRRRTVRAAGLRRLGAARDRLRRRDHRRGELRPGALPEAPPPRTGGPVGLDFNRAFIPPCGFSDFYSCPVPPPQNRIAAPIRAGEKRVRYRSGSGH